MKKIYHTSNCFKRFENYLKFSLVSLAILFTALPANATADGTKLTLSFKDSNLPAILKEIKNQTKYDFMYNSKEIDTNKKISMELKNVTLDSALKVCLTPFGLTYTIKIKLLS
ncbi:MAG: STN domain-containing protein [Butyricimonas faecihominis]